jgi:cytochrome c oxidase subunit IV
MAHHVTPIRTYMLIFIGLLVLTGVTVYTAQSPIGDWHMPVAMGIAILKAALVVLFFMHAMQSGKLTWIVIMASLFMLAVLLLMTMADYTTRSMALG